MLMIQLQKAKVQVSKKIVLMFSQKKTSKQQDVETFEKKKPAVQSPILILTNQLMFGKLRSPINAQGSTCRGDVNMAL